MREFKIKPGGFKIIRKKMLVWSTVMLLIVIACMVIFSLIDSKGGSIGIIETVVPVTVFTIIMTFSISRTVKRTRIMLDSYALTITDNMIIREQVNTPTICIYLDKIKSIVKNKNGSFVIRSKDANDIIVVPSQIDNREELETMLNTLRPISLKSGRSQLYSILLSLLVIGLGICLYISTDKILIVASGAFLAGLMVWTFIKGRKNKNMDDRARRSLWIFLVVAFAIIYAVITKLGLLWPQEIK